MVLVLHLNQTQFLLLVLTNIWVQFTTLLNLVQRFDKLISKALNPFDIFILNLDQSVANSFFPTANDTNIGLVFENSFGRVRLDLLKLFKLTFILFIDVV
jgi:hypothetical protein